MIVMINKALRGTIIQVLGFVRSMVCTVFVLGDKITGEAVRSIPTAHSPYNYCTSCFVDCTT